MLFAAAITVGRSRIARSSRSLMPPPRARSCDTHTATVSHWSHQHGRSARAHLYIIRKQCTELVFCQLAGGAAALEFATGDDQALQLALSVGDVEEVDFNRVLGDKSGGAHTGMWK